MNNRVNLMMAEETSAVTSKSGNIDNRLLGLSSQVSIQSDILTGISSDVLVNASEVEPLKVSLETMERKNSDRAIQIGESISNILTSTANILSKLDQE